MSELARAPYADPYLDIESYDPAADLMVLNLGPQHPSTHGVFRVVLYLDGEIIVKAVPYPGYLHRGVEKLCEKLKIKKCADELGETFDDMLQNY